jgi:hypothetical protein
MYDLGVAMMTGWVRMMALMAVIFKSPFSAADYLFSFSALNWLLMVVCFVEPLPEIADLSEHIPLIPAYF